MHAGRGLCCTFAGTLRLIESILWFLLLLLFFDVSFCPLFAVTTLFVLCPPSLPLCFIISLLYLLIQFLRVCPFFSFFF